MFPMFFVHVPAIDMANGHAMVSSLAGFGTTWWHAILPLLFCDGVV